MSEGLLANRGVKLSRAHGEEVEGVGGIIGWGCAGGGPGPETLTSPGYTDDGAGVLAAAGDNPKGIEPCDGARIPGLGPLLMPIMEFSGGSIGVCKTVDMPRVGSDAEGRSKKLKSSSVKAESSKSIAVSRKAAPPRVPEFMSKPMPIPTSKSMSKSISMPR